MRTNEQSRKITVRQLHICDIHVTYFEIHTVRVTHMCVGCRHRIIKTIKAKSCVYRYRWYITYISQSVPVDMMGMKLFDSICAEVPSLHYNFIPISSASESGQQKKLFQYLLFKQNAIFPMDPNKKYLKPIVLRASE